jgi:dihydrofolate reductase
MPLFHAIAAMSENRVIGDHGKIPWHLPEDFRWFKHKTMGGTLIMGRKTFESIGKPLPGRKTVVLSRTLQTIPGITSYNDIETFRAEEASNPSIWICGGAEIYQQLLLTHCSVLYLTRVKRIVEGDAFFPSFEESYTLNQIIRETSEFQIERWYNTRRAHESFYKLEPESWPFPTP